MSLVHYLTIGRFEFLEEEKERELLLRVVDHFTPGGLTRLGRAARVLAPFTVDELAQLESEVKRRFDISVNVGQYVTKDGLLLIPYLADGLFESFAEHVALVAHELFGATASDKGHEYAPADIERMSRNLLLRDAERARIADIEDGAERTRAFVQALQRSHDDPGRYIGYAPMAMRGASESAIPELTAMLGHADPEVRHFAAHALRHFGPSAAQAVPALVALFGQHCSVRAVETLGAMGRDAEPHLVSALRDGAPSVRQTAARVLGATGPISDATRSALHEIANQPGWPAPNNGRPSSRSLARSVLERLGPAAEEGKSD